MAFNVGRTWIAAKLTHRFQRCLPLSSGVQINPVSNPLESESHRRNRTLSVGQLSIFDLAGAQQSNVSSYHSGFK